MPSPVSDARFPQAVLHAGQRPTILQQLCCLPFEYFSDPRLEEILLPTLISCCFQNSENRRILEQELSPVMLASFLEVGSVIARGDVAANGGVTQREGARAGKGCEMRVEMLRRRRIEAEVGGRETEERPFTMIAFMH